MVIRYVQLPLSSCITKGEVFLQVSFLMEDLGKNGGILSDKAHCAFRSTGKTYVWDADMRFVRNLGMKHREAG